MTRAAKVWPSAGITHAGSWWSPDGLTWHLLTPANRDEVIDGGKWKILARIDTATDAAREMRAGLKEALGAKTKAGRLMGALVFVAALATGTIAAECLGADGDGSACLSLVITGPRGKVTALLNGEETRRLRAQVDEVLR